MCNYMVGNIESGCGNCLMCYRAHRKYHTMPCDGVDSAQGHVTGICSRKLTVRVKQIYKKARSNHTICHEGLYDWLSNMNSSNKNLLDVYVGIVGWIYRTKIDPISTLHPYPCFLTFSSNAWSFPHFFHFTLLVI